MKKSDKLSVARIVSAYICATFCCANVIYDSVVPSVIAFVAAFATIAFDIRYAYALDAEAAEEYEQHLRDLTALTCEEYDILLKRCRIFDEYAEKNRRP